MGKKPKCKRREVTCLRPPSRRGTKSGVSKAGPLASESPLWRGRELETYCTRGSRGMADSASSSFPMSGLFTSGGQSIRASTSASVLPMKTQDWSPLGWTGLISLQSKGLSRVFSNTTVQKHQFFGAQPSLWPNSHIQTWTGKIIAFTLWAFVSKVMSLLLNMRSFSLVGEWIKCGTAR